MKKASSSPHFPTYFFTHRVWIGLNCIRNQALAGVSFGSREWRHTKKQIWRSRGYTVLRSRVMSRPVWCDRGVEVYGRFSSEKNSESPGSLTHNRPKPTKKVKSIFACGSRCVCTYRPLYFSSGVTSSTFLQMRNLMKNILAYKCCTSRLYIN